LVKKPSLGFDFSSSGDIINSTSHVSDENIFSKNLRMFVWKMHYYSCVPLTVKDEVEEEKRYELDLLERDESELRRCCDVKEEGGNKETMKDDGLLRSVQERGNNNNMIKKDDEKLGNFTGKELVDKELNDGIKISSVKNISEKKLKKKKEKKSSEKEKNSKNNKNYDNDDNNDDDDYDDDGSQLELKLIPFSFETAVVRREDRKLKKRRKEKKGQESNRHIKNIDSEESDSETTTTTSSYSFSLSDPEEVDGASSSSLLSRARREGFLDLTRGTIQSGVLYLEDIIAIIIAAASPSSFAQDVTTITGASDYDPALLLRRALESVPLMLLSSPDAGGGPPTVSSNLSNLAEHSCYICRMLCYLNNTYELDDFNLLIKRCFVSFVVSTLPNVAWCICNILIFPVVLYVSFF
jgi:hypothetical protein